MSAATERRRLREDLHPIGIAGVALLRLHALRDPTAARACLEEMRELLDRVDGRSFEESTPLVDVVAGYDRWAEVYDLPGNPLVESEEQTVRLLLDRFDEDPVLDSACGTGRHLAYLAARGRHVIGTDLSEGMIAKARQKVPGADLRLGDLAQLPVADGEVRATICALALEHVDVLQPVYLEFARVTASGGTVLISTMHRCSVRCTGGELGS